MNEQPTTHRALTLGVSAILIVCVAAVAMLAYQKGWLGGGAADGNQTPTAEIRKDGVYIEQQNMAYSQAIEQSDANILSTLPKPDTLKADTTDEVARLFDLSRLAASFGFIRESTAYLTKILDSYSSDAEPFKSASAFFLLNDSLLDTSVGSARFMVDTVNASQFMQQLKPVAATVFPNDFAVAPEEMVPRQRTRFVTSYLVALSEREDAFAASARAASLIGSFYVYRLNVPNIDKAILEKYGSLSHTLLRRAADRAASVLPTNFARGTLSAYDAVAGLDNLAVIIEGLRLYKLESAFPEANHLDPLTLLRVAHDIATSEAPGLDMYTTYLYAVYLAEFSADSQSNNDEIERLVKRITGTPPFTQANQYSWATVSLLNSQKSPDVTDVFRRENLAAIARRSPTLREFLTVRDGWTDKDFLLKDSF